MQAITIPSYGDADVLTLTEVAEPSHGSDDLLVEVKATAVNRADVLQRRGLYPPPGPKPEHEIPGLEFAGEVLECGVNAGGFSPGDRVMGLLGAGGYAQRVAINHRLAVRVPDSFSWTDAAACPEVFITAHDALLQASATTGESLLVHAAGSGVGVAAIQLARIMGMTPVIGTAGSSEKLDKAGALGLDVGINYKDQDFVDECKAATGGRGADVVLDFIGAAYLERNVSALAEKGRMVIIGLLGGLSAEINLGAVVGKRLQIHGTLLRSRSMEEKAMVTRAFEKSVLPHLASGAIKPVVDKVFTLREAADAHRYMESNANFGKIVLEVAG